MVSSIGFKFSLSSVESFLFFSFRVLAADCCKDQVHFDYKNQYNDHQGNRGDAKNQLERHYDDVSLISKATGCST